MFQSSPHALFSKKTSNPINNVQSRIGCMAEEGGDASPGPQVKVAESAELGLLPRAPPGLRYPYLRWLSFRKLMIRERLNQNGISVG
jgi:hypothetical protein